MKFIKSLWITGMGLLILLLCSQSGLLAQDTSKLDELNIQIKQKVDEARDCLDKANQFQNKGDYDKAYEYAEKVKGISSEVSKLRGQVTLEEAKLAKEREIMAKKSEADSKIREAKNLISKAENLEADKWAPEELASAKSSLLSSQNEYEQKNYDESIKLALESINYANSCLSKVEEIKKAQELAALQKKELPDQKLVRKGMYMIKTNYTVRLIPERRDCLWRISEYNYIYNNPWKWPIIYKANKEQIKNPDLIYPGQIFDIPGLDEQGNPILAPDSTKEGTSQPDTIKKAPAKKHQIQQESEEKTTDEGEKKEGSSQEVPINEGAK